MKVSIYLPDTNKSETGWVGYIYDYKVDGRSLSFHGWAKDQFGKRVALYHTDEQLHLDTPGGVRKSSLVVKQ